MRIQVICLTFLTVTTMFASHSDHCTSVDRINVQKIIAIAKKTYGSKLQGDFCTIFNDPRLEIEYRRNPQDNSYIITIIGNNNYTMTLFGIKKEEM